MNLPASYDTLDAITRVTAGLRREGHTAEVAEGSAVFALAEAPFAAPDPDGWRRACNRARQIAAEGHPHGRYPRLDPATGLAIPPRPAP